MLLGEQAKREAALAEASPRTQRGAGGGQGAKSLAFIFMCIYLEKEGGWRECDPRRLPTTVRVAEKTKRNSRLIPPSPGSSHGTGYHIIWHLLGS